MAMAQWHGEGGLEIVTLRLLYRAGVPTSKQSKTETVASETGLLWYFSFGSNMDPDVLTKRRNVHPKQSHPCQVVGYVLTFSHLGLPYLEPGMGTIEPLQWRPQPPTLIVASHRQQKAATAEAGKATMFSTPSKPVAQQLAIATKKQKQADAAAADQDPESPRPSVPTNGVFGIPELPISFGPARSASKRSRSSPVSDASCDYESNDFDLDGSHSMASQASISKPALQNGHKYVTVHGVVHQITQEDMAQIVRTEGGGGSGHHGYYLESVPCEMYNGQIVQALTLLTHPNSRHHQVEPALPSERYLKILQKGAKQHNLSGEYQVYLQALQHYQPSSRGQLVGRWIVLNTFGRALKFFMIRIMPKVKNPFASWLTHEVLANYILVMWWLHDYIMEPALGSGRHH
ncbi:TPA: hypothetical protein ACH3X2_003910 [Trebouxia sp. C0005]